jgi:hypothetical protein
LALVSEEIQECQNRKGRKIGVVWKKWKSFSLFNGLGMKRTDNIQTEWWDHDSITYSNLNLGELLCKMAVIFCVPHRTTVTIMSMYMQFLEQCLGYSKCSIVLLKASV